ncbi:cyclodeaminase/cyclohydrolase family protein [Arthrobacter monumenti]
MTPGWEAGDYLERPLQELLDDVGGTDPAPAAGSVTAATVSLAAALTAKVAHRSTTQRPDAGALADRATALRDRVSALITADAAGYAEVLAAQRRGRGKAEAMAEAVRIPAEIAEAAAEIAELAAVLAENGNPNLRYDALAAVDLADQGAAVAASLVSANSVAASAAAAAAALAAARRATDIAAGVVRPH